MANVDSSSPDGANSSQAFDGYYSSLKNRILMRWVDVRKKAVLRKDLSGRSRLRILDLGCGTAAVSSIFRDQHVLYGVDADPTILKIAERNGLVVKEGDLTRIPYEDASFDAIVMIDSIEHTSS